MEGHLYKLNTGTFCTKSDLFLSSVVFCMVTLMVAGYICTCFLSLAQKDNLRQENSGFFLSHLQGHSTVCCATKQVPSAGLSSKAEQVRLWEGLALFPASSFFFLPKLDKTSLGTHFFACTFFCRDLPFLGAPWGSGLPCDPTTGLLPLGAERLVNTCTIDNLLTILNFILFEFAAAKDFFTLFLLPISSAIVNIHELAMEGNWHAAKLKWLSYTDLHDLSAVNMNLLGDEAEESFNHLSPLMLSHVRSMCQGGTCEKGDILHHSGTSFLV